MKYNVAFYQNLNFKHPKGVSYKTLRRDAETELPNVLLDIVRLGPDGQASEETSVSSIRQDCANRIRMVTAYVKV